MQAFQKIFTPNGQNSRAWVVKSDFPQDESFENGISVKSLHIFRQGWKPGF